MGLEIIPVYEHLDNYIKELEQSNADAQALWEKHAILPFWDKLSEFAPMDIGDRKPKPVHDAGLLKRQIELLRQLDLEQLQQNFDEIASFLPEYEETMRVALYPMDNDRMRTEQNGVLGTCTWGHIVIGIDPLADDYVKWIPYVFAHEYHHNVWGAYWHEQHQGELAYAFINDLLCDGLADAFALGFYPNLKPKWLFDISEEAEKKLWNEQYSELIDRTDVNYSKYMFGDNIDIPWCAGYAIGFRIVQQFQRRFPLTNMRELLAKRPIDIFGLSGYATLMQQ